MQYYPSTMFIAIKYFLVIALYAFGVILLTIFILFHHHSERFACYLCKEYEKPHSTYDYIIVGSGTAGSIVAQRLAENKEHTVLVLEAGSYSNSLFSIPAIGPLLQLSRVDWNFETTAQNNACKGLKYNKSKWPMGRLVGGTSRLNNMIHTRGHEKDYEMWFSDKADYNYEQDILYYFKKLENNLQINEKNSTLYSNGPVYVSPLTYESSLTEIMFESSEHLEYSNIDRNNNLCSGFSKPYVNILNGKRWTSSDALLEKEFENLKIITLATVHQVLFRNNFEAYAVKYKHLNDMYIVRARKGIILSAGVIGTTKILLLSGIGPNKHLSNLNIPVRKDLPVGNNLQDHITTGLDLITLNQTLSVTVENMISVFSAYDYFINGKGPWTSVGCEVIGFCGTTPINNLPELQFMVLPFGLTFDAGIFLRKAISIADDIWEEYFKPLIGKQVISILPILLHPESRGNVLLRDSNPESPPIINPQYLSAPHDVKVLLKGIQIIKKLLSTEPMQKLGAQIYEKSMPGCDELEFDSNNYWECYIRHLTLTSFHPVGTCKMGSGSNPESVVDFNFKVINTNKLYVADASVIPYLPSGNINAIVGLIAEKVSDIVKYIDYSMNKVCKRYEIFLVPNVC